MAYNRMMRKLWRPATPYILLNVSAYVTVVLVAIVQVLAANSATERWVTLGLLAAFLLSIVYFDSEHGRRHAHVYLGLQTALVLVMLGFSSEPGLIVILFFVLSAHAMLCLSPRPAIAWIVLFGLITIVNGVREYGPVGIFHVLPNVGGFLFFGTFGGALRQAEADKRRSEVLLEELRAAQSQLEELAVAEERNRLAREMHDSLGHRLTVAVVQLEGAQRLIPTDPERAARMIGTMREEMKEALADLRRSVAALRTPLEDGLPLDTALTRLARNFQESTGLTVHLALPPSVPTVPEAQRLALYRAAQEALTNAQRHSAARQVWLTLSATDAQLSLTVADDGRGFPPTTDTGGFGLRGLRERAQRAGGEVRLESRTGGGAQLVVSLPLEAYAHSHSAG